MCNRTFDSRGLSDDPNVSDTKIQGGGGYTGGGALTVLYGTYICVYTCLYIHDMYMVPW